MIKVDILAFIKDHCIFGLYFEKWNSVSPDRGPTSWRWRWNNWGGVDYHVPWHRCFRTWKFNSNNTTIKYK